MRALTLRQPWAAAVCHLDKRIENRSTRPPRNLPGEEVIAIHAGLANSAADREALEGLEGQMRRRGEHWPSDRHVLPLGAVVAVARVVDVIDERLVGMYGHDAFGAFSGQVERWFDGPWGWVLADVQVLAEPVPARGALGLWRLPEDVELAVRAQLAAAVAHLPPAQVERDSPDAVGAVGASGQSGQGGGLYTIPKGRPGGLLPGGLLPHGMVLTGHGCTVCGHTSEPVGPT